MTQQRPLRRTGNSWVIYDKGFRSHFLRQGKVGNAFHWQEAKGGLGTRNFPKITSMPTASLTGNPPQERGQRHVHGLAALPVYAMPVRCHSPVLPRHQGPEPEQLMAGTGPSQGEEHDHDQGLLLPTLSASDTIV